MQYSPNHNYGSNTCLAHCKYRAAGAQLVDPQLDIQGVHPY